MVIGGPGLAFAFAPDAPSSPDAALPPDAAEIIEEIEIRTFEE
jgi:hypothetical protein